MENTHSSAPADWRLEVKDHWEVKMNLQERLEDREVSGLLLTGLGLYCYA